jgi:proteasome lid subunit RPN8/RPN11
MAGETPAPQNVSDEIQFGEVEQAAPERALRPDGNRHYAVAACGEPDERDLPVFVDLDVLADMEEHSQSDTSVELGGVLLGGCFEDEHGRPFIVVSDSLRAQHYESTKGSFKFTHDTWSAITREREQFPAELQMVGWYHTHPGWGVFLSGMDMFICDNFFNKKLDVAYVIDPCRGDRGMFQWTGDPHHRVRRTGGFFVTASRFRAAELEYYVAELSGTMPATTTSRAAAGSYPAPVVHLHQPRDEQPPWQAIAIAGMLAVQLLLVGLLAWKVLSPPGSTSVAGEDKLVAAVEKLDKSLAALESRRQADLAQARAQARTEFFDAAFRELKNTDDGAISRLAERFDQTGKLTEDVMARDAALRESRVAMDEINRRLTSHETKARLDESKFKAEIADLTTENARLREDRTKYKAELASLQPKVNPKSADGKEAAAADAPVSVWWWVAGGTLAALAVVAGVWWVGGRGSEQVPPVEEETKVENQ